MRTAGAWLTQPLWLCSVMMRYQTSLTSFDRPRAGAATAPASRLLPLASAASAEAIKAKSAEALQRRRGRGAALGQCRWARTGLVVALVRFQGVGGSLVASIFLVSCCGNACSLCGYNGP